MDNIRSIKQTLSNVKYVSMATVNEDGSPHDSPVVFLYDKNFNYIYWGSHPESQHSKNILRTKRIFFVAYDSVEGSMGVYVKAEEGEITRGKNLTVALNVHNHFRNKWGKDSLSLGYYGENKPQKMWRAKVAKVWVNAYERGEDNRLVRDFKIEIDLNKLKNIW
jgi:hypothetical protein